MLAFILLGILWTVLGFIFFLGVTYDYETPIWKIIVLGLCCGPLVWITAFLNWFLEITTGLFGKTIKPIDKWLQK